MTPERYEELRKKVREYERLQEDLSEVRMLYNELEQDHRCVIKLSNPRRPDTRYPGTEENPSLKNALKNFCLLEMQAIEVLLLAVSDVSHSSEAPAAPSQGDTYIDQNY